MKKKLTAVALIVCMLAIMLVGASLAYFTDEDEATNTFTVGNVKIELTEPSWQAGDEEAEDVYPGEALPKDPTVENTGANPCFVRIKITGWDSLKPASKITYETNYVTDALNEGWILHDDGYFYWTAPLCAKGTENESWNTGLVSKTEALFDQIRIPTDLTNGFDGNYSLVVTAEAVQAQGAAPSWSNVVDGKNPVKSMTVAEIAAWFETCMAE